QVSRFVRTDLGLDPDRCYSLASTRFRDAVHLALRKACRQVRMTILDVRGISKRFGGLQALSDVTFSVPAGQIVGLIGPNGAGKTTFFSTLVGLIRPDKGAVTLAGQSLVGLKPHRIAAYGMTKTFQH